MPFNEGARITIESQHSEEIGRVYYQIDYALGKVPVCSAHFHAQWRRSMTTRELPEHTIIEGVKGKGQCVGTYVAGIQFSDGWWGEGDVKFYIDGDEEFSTICGTGTEDYFGGGSAFGFETHSTAFLGYPLYQKEAGKVPKHGMCIDTVRDLCICARSDVSDEFPLFIFKTLRNIYISALCPNRPYG